MTTATAIPTAAEDKKVFYQRETFKLIKEMINSHHFVLTHRVLIDFMDNDLVSAILLNQILYWTDRSTMNNGWFYKSHAEWEIELAVSPFQIKTRLNGDDRVEKEKRTLRDVGVETRFGKMPGSRQMVTYYRLDIPMFFGLLHDFLESREEYHPGHISQPHESYVDNVLLNIVQEEGKTLLGGGAEHCSSSSLNKEYITENTTLSLPYPPDQLDDDINQTNKSDEKKSNSNNNTQSSQPEFHNEKPSAPPEISAKPKDTDLDFIKPFQRNFKPLRSASKAHLRAEISRLGEEKVLEVAERCRNKGGRSWNYLFAALEREDAVEKLDSQRSWVERFMGEDIETINEMNERSAMFVRTGKQRQEEFEALRAKAPMAVRQRKLLEGKAEIEAMKKRQEEEKARKRLKNT